MKSFLPQKCNVSTTFVAINDLEAVRAAITDRTTVGVEDVGRGRFLQCWLPQGGSATDGVGAVEAREIRFIFYSGCLHRGGPHANAPSYFTRGRMTGAAQCSYSPSFTLDWRSQPETVLQSLTHAPPLTGVACSPRLRHRSSTQRPYPTPRWWSRTSQRWQSLHMHEASSWW